jgi:hypothetical protein
MSASLDRGQSDSRQGGLDDGATRGVESRQAQSEPRGDRSPIRAQRGDITPDQFRARLAALNLSQRQFTRLAGLHERSIRRYSRGQTGIPEWVGGLLQGVEMDYAVRDLLASLRPGQMIPRGKLAAIYGKFHPPAKQPEKPVKPEKVPKPIKHTMASLKKRYRKRTYDQPWVPYPVPEHPATAGFRTVMTSIKSG